MKSLLPSLFSRSACPFLPGRRTGGRSGFTMLELVAVIGIIAVMSVVVVSGYANITRSLAAQAGTDALKRTLSLARQQACIDGVDTYVWITGVDTFVVVRRAGTVCAKSSGSRTPDYLQTDGTFSVDGKWIIDDYADLSGASQAFRFDSSTTPQQKEEALENYSKGDSLMLVFDMNEAKTAIVEYPPFFEPALDAWVFGVKDYNGAFDVGHAYGWLALPEQKLPKGFSFDVPYTINPSTGDVTVDANNVPRVHFLPDGSVEQKTTFRLKDASGNASRPEVSVDGDGRISAKTK